MVEALHPSEFQAHFVSSVRAKAVAYGTLSVAVALSIGSLFTSNHWAKTSLLVGAGASIVLSRVAVANQVMKDRILQDIEDISDASRQQRLYELMQPSTPLIIPGTDTSKGAEPYEPELFDWHELVLQANRHPHIMLLGSTGDGKTTLVEWLHSMMEGKRVALHPHWQASEDESEVPDFRYCDQVIGGGRNFSAIAEYLSWLYSEMDRRAKLTMQQLRACPVISVAVDELPAIAKNCGEETIEQLISLIFEARKFRIRLVVLAQADSVRVLKLEGQGAVRESLTYIRLGSQAIDHAKFLVARKQVDERLPGWLEKFDRPAMVEDMPAVIPLIGKGQGLPMQPVVPSSFAGNQVSYPGGLGISGVTPWETPGVTTGRGLEVSGVTSYPAAPTPDMALIHRITHAVSTGNLSSEYIKKELGFEGKYYAGARRFIGALFGGNVGG